MGKLDDKSALITGADSGIGKAVALLFALEGADIAIIYHSSDQDAEKTKTEIENLGRKCIILQGILTIMNSVKQLPKKPFQPLEKLIS